MNPYRNAYVTSINSIPSSGDTLSLAVTQLGVFNADTYQATTAPNFPAVKAILIAQGRDSRTFPKGAGLSNENPKTQPIKAKNIVGWEGIASQKPQNMIVTLGFDGIDTSKTFAPKVGKDVNIYVTLSGAPIGNLMGGSSTTKYNTLTEVFTPVFPCPDDCADNCGDVVDCNLAVDSFIDQFNKRKIVGGEYLHKYIRVSKITSCDTPSGYPTITCTKYQLQIPDNGDQAALGEVQAQYAGVNITRVNRAGIISTYEAVYCSGSPDAYVANGSTVIPDCGDCPSGYTEVEALASFTVSRTDAGTAANLATLNVDYNLLIVTANTIRLSYVNGYSTYQVWAPVTTTVAMMNTTAATVGKGDIITDLGVHQSVCVGNGLMTYDWTSEGTCYKALKFYHLDYANTPCGDSILTTLQALYASVGTVTQSSAVNCVRRYTIGIYSDESCLTCSDQTYTFRVPDPYQGSPWVQDVTTPTGIGCSCGVKFESAYVQRDRAECYFSEVSYEVEPLFIKVSTVNPDTHDFTTLCDPLIEQIPVTQIQNIKYAKGLGSSVLSERVKLSNFYSGRPWKTDPAERNAMGYELGIDLQGYYDEFILTYLVDIPDGLEFSGFGTSKQELHEDHFYFPAGEGAAFVSAINSFVVSSGTNLSAITV